MNKNKIVVIVGSTNPVKVRATKKAFAKYFKQIKVFGIAVDSGISAQPMSFEKAYTGALNRVNNVLKKYPEADYAVGLEGTLQPYSFGWTTAGLVVVMNKQGEIGLGISSQLLLPQKLVNLTKKKELGLVVEDLSGIKNIKQKGGVFGVFTKNVLTREQAYFQAIIFSLSRFINSRLY